MKILFVIRSISHLSYVSSVIEGLFKKGYSVEILLDKIWSGGTSSDFMMDLSRKFPCKFGILRYRNLVFRKLIFVLREIKSYLNYVGLDQSPYYINRWNSYLPFGIRNVVKIKPIQTILTKLFKNIDDFIPPVKKIVSELSAKKPDVVVATPCNHRFSNEIEYIKAAKLLNIPTAILTLSWDNLSTKGTFHVHPDIFLAWNEAHKREAVTIHNISREKIKITGSPFFDKWFDGSSKKEERKHFCNRMGLSGKKYFLYLGSSAKIAENEAWLVKRIKDNLPDYDVLIRPHPKNTLPFEGLGFPVFPKEGALPETEKDQNDFFNAIKHCEFSVGINTSAMIDSIVLEKPTIAMICDKYKRTQKDTYHFNLMRRGLYTCYSVSDIPELLGVIEEDDFLLEERQWFAKTYIHSGNAGVSAATLIGGLCG